MMKKTLLYLAASLTTLLILCGCTRNHGDIGIWFGTWHVEQITTGGAPVNVEGDYFFQFQNKVFRVSQVYGHEQLVESFGIWDESDDGDVMTISFPDSSAYYIVMPGLEVNNEFSITRMSSHEVTLTKTDLNGTTFAYHIKRQP